MDTHEILTSVQPPQRARKKHIVLFVIACVLLVGMLIFLSMPTGMEVPEVSDEPVDPYVPVGGFIYLIGKFLLVGFMVFVALLAAWITGLVLAVKLARRKADMPKWLWVASLVLVGGYLVPIAVLVVAMFV